MNHLLRVGLLLIILTFAGKHLSAQQLICPDLSSSSGGTSTVFSPAWNANLSLGRKYIPTVVHLIGDASALTYQQVRSAINQLNIDYNDHPNDLHSFEFVLASISPKGECTDGVIKWPSILYNDQLYKFKTQWPNDQYLNIWVLSDPNVLGVVSVQPSHFTVVAGQIIRTDVIAGQNGIFDSADGVTINTTEIYPNSTGGHTLTHEVGHWLNLLHVFSPCENSMGTNFPGVWDCCYNNSQGTTQGDFIGDTPPQFYFATANPSDCSPTVISTCTGASTVSQDNFMSYGGPCINKFTDGQQEWMTYCADNFRSYIWSDENLRCTGVNSQKDPVIAAGQNITWNLSNTPGGIRTIVGSLTIEPTATLTIASGITVQFCDQGKLIVQVGAELHHYGTLTSTCKGRMWQGVEVWGKKTQTQYIGSGTQGRMWGYSGAIIEHAIIGVRLNNPLDALGTSTGGVLACDGVSFKNNGRGVLFEPYENHYPWNQMPTNNLSSFTRCQFLTDNNYLGDNPGFYSNNDQIYFRAFADLKGVRSIHFTGCQFLNLRTNNELALEVFYGYGIISTEAGFIVSGYCSSPPSTPSSCPDAYLTKSTFKNLFTAIWVGNTELNANLAYRYGIMDANFEGNWVGIRSTAGSRGFIVKNRFKIGALPPNVSSFSTLQGLILEDTHTSFTVEENIFLLDANAVQGLRFNGIEAVSIGQVNETIRKNYFTGLNKGNYSVGANAKPDGSTGLLYLCNENTDNDDYDFELNNNSRIKTNQGASVSGQLRSAGNYFSHTATTGGESDFKTQFNISYYHDIPVLETPQYYDPNHLFLILSQFPRSCESIFCDPPCRTESEIAARESQIDEAIADYNEITALYNDPQSDPNLAAAWRLQMENLQFEIQTLTADVVNHLVYTNGDRTKYRSRMAALNAYEADLSLANDYLGAGDLTNYNALMNGMESKYGIADEDLASFNAYRSVTDMLALQYTDGGDKFNLSTIEVDWLKEVADNSPYLRTRGMAKRILMIYGIYYPVDYSTDTEERGSSSRVKSVPDFYTIYPNPAANNVNLIFEKGIDGIPVEGRIRLLDARGNVISDRIISISDGAVVPVSVEDIPEGIYFIQASLNSGKTGLKSVIIMH